MACFLHLTFADLMRCAGVRKEVIAGGKPAARASRLARRQSSEALLYGHQPTASEVLQVKYSAEGHHRLKAYDAEHPHQPSGEESMQTQSSDAADSDIDEWVRRVQKHLRKQAVRFGSEPTRSTMSLGTSVGSVHGDQSQHLEQRYEKASADIDDLNAKHDFKNTSMNCEHRRQRDLERYGQVMKQKLTRLGSTEVDIDTEDRASAVREGVRRYYEQCRHLQREADLVECHHKRDHLARHDSVRLDGAIRRLQRFGAQL